MRRRRRVRRGVVNSKTRRSKARPIKCRPSRLLSRLLGMETEYATTFMDGTSHQSEELPSAREVYRAIVDRIRSYQPTAIGLYDHDQVFLASGGAVNFESHPSLQSQPGGLIEIATPEVRSIHELIACQRSIDDLVAMAASQTEFGLDLRVLKNSSDARGHTYGCQENYETEVARGVWLVIYRAFVLLLWVMQVLSFLAAIPLVVAATAMTVAARLFSSATDRQRTEALDVFTEMPPGVLALLVHSLRLVNRPIVIVLRFVGNHIAFRPQRRYLAALLVSRVAVASTGELDQCGRFRLSAKAMTIDSVADMGGFNGERPIFVYGHWLSQLCAKSFFSLSSTRSLLKRSQRLQIGLSDSNLCDLAEYVKVGSVALVLDMIERGFTSGLPQLHRPLFSLHRITCDWNLVSRVPTSRGEMSAIEIQQLFHREATRFVATIDGPSQGEAQDVLQRWGDAIELIKRFRRDVNDIEPSLGRIDWLSKLWMLRQLDSGAGWAVRKKVDLRYHELSPDGYFRKLIVTQPQARIVTHGQIDQRRHSPPCDSPAARRGWLIREFAGLDAELRAEWSHATVTDGARTRRVEFDSVAK